MQVPEGKTLLTFANYWDGLQNHCTCAKVHRVALGKLGLLLPLSSMLNTAGLPLQRCAMLRQLREPQISLLLKRPNRICEGIVPAASSSNMTGPWQTGNDPWANDKGLSSGISPPSQHVQQKIDDVEQRLQDSVKAQVSASVEQIAFQINPDDGKDARMTTVENQVQALMRGQQALELWMQDSNTKINESGIWANAAGCWAVCWIQAHGQSFAQVASEVSQRSSSLAEQGSSISQVVKEVGGLKEALGP